MTFDPNSLAGLVAWYDASNSASVIHSGSPAADTETVTQWQDLSGHGYHLSSSVIFTNPPTLSATGLGGKRTIVFTTASTAAQATDASGADTVAMGTGNKMSCFAVARQTASTAPSICYLGTGVAYGSQNTDANSATLLTVSATQNLQIEHSFGSYASNAVSLSTNYRLTTIMDGTNAKSWVNGASPQSSALNFNWTSPGTLTLNQGDVNWSEIIIYNTDRTADLATVDAYLATKWFAAPGDLKLYDPPLDSGLGYLANADKLYICSQVPTTYAEATTGGTYALGNSNITPGAPAAHTGGGRQVTVPAISAGSVTNSGTPTYWALVRTGSPSALLATGQLTGVALTSGQSFSLQAMTIIQAGVSV